MARWSGLFKAPGSRARLAAAMFGALLLWGRTASAQVPPDETWRTLDTEHFRVTFPQGLEALGRRAAAHAERALASLDGAFIEPPDRVIDVLLTDHVDVSNGFAQILPSDRITIYARPPVDELGLGYFDEWLELVIVHELAHVLHLDRTVNPLGKLGRAVLGRYPTTWPIFTTLLVPRWTTEGLATWYESRLTSSGRVHGTFHETIVRTALLEDRFPGIDQAGGESPVWPGGNRAYAFGSLFFDHLLERHGEERMADFVTASAGQWIPYRLDAAARQAFDSSFSAEWAAWEEELRARYRDLDAELARLGPLSSPERLTGGARYALYPRASPDGSRVAYARADGRSDPQIGVLVPGGGPRAKLVRTNGLATFDWIPDGGVLLAQLEFTDPYRVYGDLYLVDPGGSERRVTRGARLTHPSAAPDGRRAVAVREGGGTNALVLVDVTDGAVRDLVPPEPEVHWAFPAFSPDGAWIAASRWSLGGYLDIVILDATGREVLELTHDRAMDLAPAWSPDGRWVVWGSDRTGIQNVLAASVDPAAGVAGEVRMVTNVRTGAAYPSVDPSGRWVYFSGYHADGWEVERVPFAPDSGRVAPAAIGRFDPAVPYVPPSPEAVPQAARPYAPLATLRPYYWEPFLDAPVSAPAVPSLGAPRRDVLGLGLGARTSGHDLVGRHFYDAQARYRPESRTLGGALAYSWAGLGNPVVSVATSQVWSGGGPFLTDLADGSQAVLYTRERDRSVLLGATLERRRWRHLLALTLSGGLSWEHAEVLEADLEPSSRFVATRPESRFGDLRATLSFSTARSHAFQMGAADGVSAVVRARTRTELGLPPAEARLVGSDRSFDEMLGRFSLYRAIGGPGHAAHLLATRWVGGRAWGPEADAAHFVVGGAAGRPESVTGLALFGGSGLTFPVRGFAGATRSGVKAWAGSVEYRFPLALVDRGLGAWPAHLDRVIGTLFADAGNAWGPELGVAGYQNPRRGALAAVGAEVTVQTLLLWSDELRLRLGGALPLTAGPREALYLRVGLSF